jgi:hypothetical protein
MNLKLTFTISDAKVDEYISDYIYVHKNTETIPDPDWVDPQDGSEAPQIVKYSDKQWVKEHILRHIKGQIIRGKNAKAKNALEENNADEII